MFFFSSVEQMEKTNLAKAEKSRNGRLNRLPGFGLSCVSHHHT